MLSERAAVVSFTQNRFTFLGFIGNFYREAGENCSAVFFHRKLSHMLHESVTGGKLILKKYLIRNCELANFDTMTTSTREILVALPPSILVVIMLTKTSPDLSPLGANHHYWRTAAKGMMFPAGLWSVK